MKTRNIVHIAILAALYAVLTIGVAPISYGIVQFRVSEVLKVFVLFNPMLAFGIGIGTFIANMMSPFVSVWELVWMPLTDVLGGLVAWFVYRYTMKMTHPFFPMLIYAVLTGLAVSVMLTALQISGFWIAFASVVFSEAIILICGIPLIFRIVRTISKLGIEI